MSAREAIRRSAEDLQLRVETHCRLLAQSGDGGDARVQRDASPSVDSTDKDCLRRRRPREALADAITVLDETRKAFKSKQLGILRKRLLGVLSENA